MQNDSARRVLGVIVAALTAVILFVAAALPAAAMTVTFVRHGESEGNASGFIDTSVPGPNLTPLGQTQAEAVAAALMASGVDYDAVYASNMVRTTQTAQPFVDATGLPVTVLPGVREPQTSVYNVARAFSTGDISQIATAIRDGVIDTVAAPIKFATAVVRDVVDAVSGALRPASVNAPAVQAKTAAPDVASVPDSGHRPAKKTVVERVAVEVPAVTEDADTDAEELNGATDLTDGNKVAPGVAHEVSRSAEKLREAAEGVSKQVEASLTKLSDAVAKATGQAGGANESGDAGDGAAAAEKDAA